MGESCYDTNLVGAGCRAVWLGGGECGGGRAGYDIDARPRRLPTCVALGLRMYWSWLVRVFWGEFFLARTHAHAREGLRFVMALERHHARGYLEPRGRHEHCTSESVAPLSLCPPVPKWWWFLVIVPLVLLIALLLSLLSTMAAWARAGGRPHCNTFRGSGLDPLT